MNRIIKEAKIVFGPNGAAMCNILFASTTEEDRIIYSTLFDDYYFEVSNSLSYISMVRFLMSLILTGKVSMI